MRDLTQIESAARAERRPAQAAGLAARRQAGRRRRAQRRAVGALPLAAAVPLHGGGLRRSSTAPKARWPRSHDAFWIAADAADDSVLAAISLGFHREHELGEIGYWCGPVGPGRGVMTRRRETRPRLGLRRARLRSASRSCADLDNVGSQRVAHAAGFIARGRAARLPAGRAAGVDDVLYAHAARRPATGPGERRRRRSRLAAAHGRPAGRPALRAGRRPGRAGRLRRPRRRPLDLRPAGAVQPRRRRVVHRRRPAPASPPASAPGSPSRTRASGELLGSVSLDRFADRQAAEIGYWVKREARRRGVALGAARLVVAWAFGELGIERLELLTYPGNEASQSLAARLGFTRECLLRGFLAPEPGKSREGRAVPSDGRQPAAPRRPGAVRAPARRLDAIRLRTRREAPDLAEPAPLSGLSPERFSLDPANLLDEKSLRAFT